MSHLPGIGENLVESLLFRSFGLILTLEKLAKTSLEKVSSMYFLIF